jgi:protein-S-isoprenylcysteine O-methyltransferase Ste14
MMPQISTQEFEELPLRVHEFLSGVPLHDAWVVDLPRTRSGITLDEYLRYTKAQRRTVSSPVRALMVIRLFLGRVLGWDREPAAFAWETFATRLTAKDLSMSLVPAGTHDGIFRVVYRFENEQLLELMNGTVHGAMLTALFETSTAYRFYLGVYVRKVSRFTPIYLALIDPVRKLVVYPSLLRSVCAIWGEFFPQPEMSTSKVKRLAGRTILGFTQLIAFLGAALFVPAWTLNFWQGWVYLSIFAAASALITAYLWKYDRKLLESRLKAGPRAEKKKSQKLIQFLASLAFIGILVLPSLDRRYRWSHVGAVFVIMGDALAAFGFLAVFIVYRENTFTSATIEVAPNQRVISTGPYAVVRHPMYAGALVMLFATPLALGSWWGLVMFIPMTLVIVLRLLDEERFLQESLSGYTEYCGKIRFRLIPRIW